MSATSKPARLRRLDINFADRQSLAAWARWAILAAGALTLVTQAQSYAVTRQRVADIEMRTARLSATQGPERTMPRDPKEVETQIAAIERVVNRLTFEWHILFTELERPITHDIALGSIEPDPGNRSLNVTGVAKDYLALLSYVGTLRESKVLTNVFLRKHEIARNQPQQGVAFTLTANWHELASPDANRDLKN